MEAGTERPGTDPPGTTVAPGTRLEGVLALGRAMNAARSPVDLAESTAEEICHALPAASVSISRLEVDRGLLRTLVNVGDLAPWEERRPQDETYPLDETEVLQDPTTRAAAVYSLDDPTCPASEADILRRCGKRTSLNVAILYDGRAWGELAAFRGADDPPFTSADLSYAEAIAGFAALGFAQAEHAAQATLLATQDPLTGLGNRRAADFALDAAVDRHRATGVPVAVLLCDVNDLKQVNDRRGHAEGDDLLRRVARSVAAAASAVPGAVACRIGGDEFCVIAPVRSAEAARLGERICALAERVDGDVPLAVGVAASDTPGLTSLDTPAVLLRLADAAQYRAKRTRSPRPVESGRDLPVEVPAPLGEPSDPEERRRRRRRRRDPESRTLALAEAVVAELRTAGPGAARVPLAEAEQHRLVALARTAARSSGAASWYLSRVDPGRSTALVVAGAASRSPGGAGAEEAVDLDGRYWSIADRPASAAVLDGGAFSVSADDVGADPAQLARLDALGQQVGHVAGVRAPSGTRWVLELYADLLSREVAGLDAVLPGLLALAVLVPAREPLVSRASA